MPPPAGPAILGGMGERDDYDDGDGDVWPSWLPPAWALGVMLGVGLFVGFLTALIVVRTIR